MENCKPIIYTRDQVLKMQKDYPIEEFMKIASEKFRKHLECVIKKGKLLGVYEVQVVPLDTCNEHFGVVIAFPNKYSNRYLNITVFTEETILGIRYDRYVYICSHEEIPLMCIDNLEKLAYYGLFENVQKVIVILSKRWLTTCVE